MLLSGVWKRDCGSEEGKHGGIVAPRERSGDVWFALSPCLSRLRRLSEDRGIQRDSGVWRECLVWVCGAVGVGVVVWLRGLDEVVLSMGVVLSVSLVMGLWVSKLVDADFVCVGVGWIGLSMPSVAARVICADNDAPVLTQGRTVNDKDGVSGILVSAMAMRRRC